MKAIVKFIIKFRTAVLIIMGLITAFFITQIFHMEMFTQFLDLFPSNHPYVEIHKLYAKYFGGAYQATLMLEVKEGGAYKDVFNLETLRKIYRIQYDVDLIPGVDHFGIFSLASPKVTIMRETETGVSAKPIMKTVPPDQEGIEDLKRKVFTSPVNGTLVSYDQKALLLNANFIEGRIDFNKLFDDFMKIKKKEEDANHRIYLSGMPLVYGWIYHYVPNMLLILVITSAIIVALLYGYMYQGGLWWRPFLDGIITSTWGLGFSAWIGFHFDPLIIVIPFLLSARAISHGVQWTERFVEEYRRLNGDIQQASLITGVALFPPGLIGIVADTWALLIIAIPPLINLKFPIFHFAANPIPTLRNLAFIGTFWALSAIFSSLVLNPALFASFKKLWIPMEYKENAFDRILKQVLGKLSSWTFGTGRYITVSIAIAVLIVAIIDSRSLKFGDANPGSPIFWQHSEYNKDTDRINTRFPGVDQMWIVIEGKKRGDAVRPDVIKGMEAIKYYMMEDPNVGFATSIADMITSTNMLARGNDPKMEYAPTEEAEINNILFFIMYGSAPGDMDPWIDYAFEGSNVRLYLKNHEGSLLTEVINRVKTFIKSNPNLMENAVAKPAGGLGGILAAANELIESRNDPILFFILAVIFIHCSVTYWSILAGVIFTISLILANFLAFTYMAIKGIGLNINTFPVVSLGIGMGVDYGLYIVSRIIEVYREEKDLEKSVRGGIVTAGRAVFFTATMMSAGIIFWVFSPLRFQAEMGLLLGILMMVNMVVGVLVLPAVINIIRPKFITHSRV